ncbi:MAG: metallophosphoesterase [Rhodocyclaceae bacterium]|nr:metallophosphoesterase [Rhodocyclaceae bacterium]
MKTITQVIQHDGRSNFTRLYPVSDVHIGHRACDEKAFARYVKQIADDPDGMWVGIGDYVDAINRSDPRFSTFDLPDWALTREALADIVTAQRDRFLELTAPIHDKCLALLAGNHEMTISKYYERDAYGEIVAAIARDKGVEMDTLRLDYTGWMLLKFIRSTGKSSLCRVWMHHGHGGGQLKGAKALKLQRLAWAVDADLIIHGHVHDAVISPGHRACVTDSGVAYVRQVHAMITGASSRRG